MTKRRLLFGRAINDADYPVRPRNENGDFVTCPFYQVWHSMLKRCYSRRVHAYRPTYHACKVANHWLRFMGFRAWMITQKYEGLQLDKDLLANAQPGKLYAPNVCCFVPSWLNNFFLDHHAARGPYPQGVNWHKSSNTFHARISVIGDRQHLGKFSCPQEAHAAWLVAKRDCLEQLLSVNSIRTDIAMGARRCMETLEECNGN